VITERIFALDELGDPSAPQGSRDWAVWVANQIEVSLYDKEQHGQRLHRLTGAFKEKTGWQELGFLTWEMFCDKRLHRPSADIDAEAELRRHGTNRHSDKSRDSVRNIIPIKGGNNKVYLKARITRDYPETLKDVGKGKKYKTYSAAAVALGIKKPDNRHMLPADATAAGRYLASRVDNEWKIAFLDAFMKAQGKR